MRTRLAGTARLAAAALTGGVLAAAAGCTGSSGGATPTDSAPPSRTLTSPSYNVGHPGTDWPTYGHDFARTGVAANMAPAGPLSVSWRARLDGAVYGQPLLVGSTVIAATENDSIYALDQATGKVIWRSNVGTPVPLASLPCGNIDPLGITGTPVYDAANGLVYAVAETPGYHHVLIGVSSTDGTIQVERDIPAPDGQPRYDQQRPALTIENGRVYVAFGGLYGDCGPYRGSVVGIPLSGAGPLVSYVVPTEREGAIWGTAGPVTALSPALKQTGIFAPSSWYHDSQNDLDLGSTQPALLASGMLLADGKSGTAYLISAAHLGGVGGQVAQAPVCPAYGGASVQGTTVYEPCEQGGMAAISTAGNKIRVLWRGPASAWGSPVVGGGAVWVTDWTAGTLYELNPASGATRYSLRLGTPLPHFSSMSMVSHRAYLGTMDGVVAVAGA
jgi:outer membrane protein assembly factor BamB